MTASRVSTGDGIARVHRLRHGELNASGEKRKASKLEASRAV
ncbi:hypothetical protein [Kibdelosporangium philippinense]